ncbi:MAG: histidinol-phosphate transaminase [Firmicutes bacterium]|nr:histidinol-phosphate transaminase [Bacillota bacterium]
MSRFLNPRLSKLKAYTPGEQPQDKRYIKLNTNESPYPPSPVVIDAVKRARVEELRLYSDPEGKVLKKKLAELYGLGSENVFISNGSDDILNFAFMAFAGEGIGARFPDITYSFYKVFADLHGVLYETVPLAEDFSIRPEDYYGTGALTVIANPNAPTGIALTREQIREVLESNPDRVVVIDEAYVDFGAESSVPLIQEYPNLLVVMTYSKSRALAGARLGIALASPELIADLELLKYSTNPYNVNQLTMDIGCAAVDSDGYFRDICRKIIETREDTVRALVELGFRVLPSKTNFLFITREGLNGKDFYLALKERGILVRHFARPRIENFVRVTVGTPEEMEAFLAAAKEIIQTA